MVCEQVIQERLGPLRSCYLLKNGLVLVGAGLWRKRDRAAKSQVELTHRSVSKESKCLWLVNEILGIVCYTAKTDSLSS